MKIVTWNVNSIRVREEIVLNWLSAHQPDVLLLQETKVVDELFPREKFAAAGYHLAIHGQKSLNGVAILSRHEMTDIEPRLPGEDEDEQARYIEATIQGCRIASVYVPNGTKYGSDKFEFKMRFYDRMAAHFKRRLKDDLPFVVAGDYNAAPDPIDVYDPEECANYICYLTEERRKFRSLIHLGYYDAYRAIYPTKRQYTWWDLRGGSWDRDEGMRIDHLLCSPKAADRLKDAGADATTRKGKGVSDHIPVWCEIQ